MIIYLPKTLTGLKKLEENLSKLRLSPADVLKKLTFLSHEKKLSFREQTLLDKSRFLIMSEIINSNSADEDALRGEIDRLVELACRKHLRSQPRVMTATVH